MNLGKKINDAKEFICRFCSNDDLANFIRVTGALGQVLSSLAFTGSIITNDELPAKQKASLTTQEILEGIINVSLFWMFTSKAKKFGEKLIADKKAIPRFMKKMLPKKFTIEHVNNLNLNDIQFQEYKSFQKDFPTFAGFAGSVISTAIISPIMKNITSTGFMKLREKKEKQLQYHNDIKHMDFMRKKSMPIDKYISTVTSPSGMRI